MLHRVSEPHTSQCLTEDKLYGGASIALEDDPSAAGVAHEGVS